MSSCTVKKPRLAVQETLATNFLVNRFDLAVLGVDWARVDFETWSNNLNLGWEWDENSFLMNMFAHPFHGSLYFNAGRTNCLSYWESIPVVFLGSWTWEYFGEIHRPSFNDFFMTSFGGIALGEITHRVAATIRNDESRGAKRVALEIAAMVINPIEGFNRLFRGDWKRVGPNPPEHDPGAFIFWLSAGARTVYEDSTGIDNFAPTTIVEIGYGDIFDTPYKEPFDVFSVRAQVSPGGGGGLNSLQASGRLFQSELPSWFGGVRNAFTVNHHFDYLNNPVYRYGAQGIEVGIISRYSVTKGYGIRTLLAGDFVVMGAIDAATTDGSERAYDFGPSIGGKLEIVLERNGRRILSFTNRAEYLHSVSGTPADHLVAFSGFEANLLVYRGLGAGIFLRGNSRNSQYTDRGEIARQFLETHVFLTWTNHRRAEAGVR